MATTSKRTSAATTRKAPAKNPAAPARKAAVKKAPAKRPKDASSHVLSELKDLARELKQAAKGLNKKTAGQKPKEVSSILGSVERMTADAANKSLAEAEAAKVLVGATLDSLSKNWNRQDIESHLKAVSAHLTNIIVAQEFQDLAGQSLRKATKALVGAIIVVEGGGPTEDKRLSQSEIDGLMKDLMP